MTIHGTTLGEDPIHGTTGQDLTIAVSKSALTIHGTTLGEDPIHGTTGQDLTIAVSQSALTTGLLGDEGRAETSKSSKLGISLPDEVAAMSQKSTVEQKRNHL